MTWVLPAPPVFLDQLTPAGNRVIQRRTCRFFFWVGRLRTAAVTHLSWNWCLKTLPVKPIRQSFPSEDSSVITHCWLRQFSIVEDELHHVVARTLTAKCSSWIKQVLAGSRLSLWTTKDINFLWCLAESVAQFDQGQYGVFVKWQ